MNTWYILKYWISTLLLGAAFINIADVWKPADIGNNLSLSITVFLFSIVFSLPALFFYTLFFIFLRQNQVSSLSAKCILTGYTAMAIVITFNLIGGTLASPLTWSFATGAIISGIMIRMRKTELPGVNNIVE